MVALVRNSLSCYIGMKHGLKGCIGTKHSLSSCIGAKPSPSGCIGVERGPGQLRWRGVGAVLVALAQTECVRYKLGGGKYGEHSI